MLTWAHVASEKFALWFWPQRPRPLPWWKMSWPEPGPLFGISWDGGDWSLWEDLGAPGEAWGEAAAVLRGESVCRMGLYSKARPFS